MQEIAICRAEPYNTSMRRIFAGVYNDFKDKAVKEYHFELEPLSYEKFIQSVEKELLQCIVLLEDGIPTGFLAYTTLISEALELNIIHCIDSRNINDKRKLLLEKFIEINKQTMREKIVTYPMLGAQADFAEAAADFGFKTVNTAVMSFSSADVSAINKIREMKTDEPDTDYKVINWKRVYRKYAAEIMYEAFKDSSDALFDSRFKTYKGCSDIVSKIIDNTYGVFLPEITKVLLYKDRPAGVFMVNKTNDKIANIPIAAILKKHRAKGLSRIILKKLIFDLINFSLTKDTALKELNVSCDADNEPAVRMYHSAGFRKDYSYPMAYHPFSV